MKPPWLALRGGVRLVSPDFVDEATRAIEDADEASLSDNWPGILALKTTRGWAWKTVPRRATTDDEVLYYATAPGAEWSILRAPGTLMARVDAAEAAWQAQRAAEEERLRQLRSEVKASERAAWMRAAQVTGGSLFGVLVVWHFWTSRKREARQA